MYAENRHLCDFSKLLIHRDMVFKLVSNVHSKEFEAIHNFTFPLIEIGKYVRFVCGPNIRNDLYNFV